MDFEPNNVLDNYVDINIHRRMSKRAVVPFEVTREVRDACICLHVQRAARALARRYDDAFRPLDLRSGQFSLLMALNRPAPPTMSQVASVLAMDRTTLTANLKPLVRRGLVQVKAADTDKRNRLLHLTPTGHHLLTAALPLWRQAQAETGQRLARSNLERLRTDLLALT